MGSKLTATGVNQFGQGLFTAKPAHDIPDGASPFMKNVDIARAFDNVLAKRKGTSTRVSQFSVTAFPRISGLWEFIRFDAGSLTGSGGTDPTPDIISTLLYVDANEDCYEIVNGTPISRYHNDAVDGTNFNHATFNNFILTVNENIATQRGQGNSDFTPLLGTPPANGKFIQAHKGRVFIANTSAGRSRVHWSAADNCQDWVSVLDAGFVDVNPDDGQEITNMIACGEYLYIFKRHSLYVLSGNKPDNFYLYPVAGVDGCCSPRGAVNEGSMVIYASDSGVRTISGGNQPGELTPLIRYTYNNIPSTAKEHIALGFNNRRQLWMAFDNNADGVNDSAYVCNLQPQVQCWTFYTNIKASIFLTLNNTDFISGGDDKCTVRTHDVGDADEGAIIPFEWHSKEHEVSSVYDYKKLIDVGIHAKVLAGKNITIDTLVDNIDQNDTLTVSLSQTLGAAQDHMTKLTKMTQNEQGRTIQFIFKNSEANAPIEIYSYTFLTEIIERQYSD